MRREPQSSNMTAPVSAREGQAAKRTRALMGSGASNASQQTGRERDDDMAELTRKMSMTMDAVVRMGKEQKKLRQET